MKPCNVRYLAIGTLLLSLFTPLLFFQINDRFFTPQKVEWNSKVAIDLRKTYPIIDSIYHNYYRSNALESISISYDVTDISIYEETIQTNLVSLRNSYTNAINELLVNKVIPYSYLDLKQDETFQVTFGTVVNNAEKKEGYYDLTQYFQIEKDLIKSMTYRLDAATNKITSASFTSPNVSILNESEMKTQLWNYIKYLGLDNIEDWSYREHAYESYQAKLQVYGETSIVAPDNTYEMGICPLGQYKGRYRITQY